MSNRASRWPGVTVVRTFVLIATMVLLGLAPKTDAVAQQAAPAVQLHHPAAVLGTDDVTPPRPVLRPMRVGAQLAAGFGGGLAGFFVGAPLGAAVGAGIGEITPLPTGKSALTGGVMGAYAGIVAGAAAAVYYAGRTDEQTASFGATLAGATAGVAAGIVIKRISHTPVGSLLYTARPILTLPPAGAALAFTLTRSFR